MIKFAGIKVNDKIYTDYRHFLIMPVALKDNPDISYITQEIQGFVTDTGEFVDRETASRIAYESGQLKEPKRILYSEDLW